MNARALTTVQLTQQVTTTSTTDLAVIELIRSLRVPALLLDSAHVVRACNGSLGKMASELLAYTCTEQQIIGCSYDELLGALLPHTTEPNGLEQIAPPEPVTHRIDLTTGGQRWIESDWQNWHSENGVHHGYIVFLRDISQDIAADKLLRDANEELTQVQYHLSHDLAAPIASARGLLGLVTDDLAAGVLDEVPEFVSETEQQLQRLDRLVSDLMSLARAGVANSTVSEFALKPLIDEIASQLSLNPRELETSVTLHDECSHLRSDRVRIMQILTNLISNSRKFQDPEEPAPDITIRATRSSQGVRIEVSDNGVGIDDTAAPGMFDMFTRGSSEQPGHGLGLYIVRKHIAKLGGQLQAVSLRKPTVFRIDLPDA